MSYTGKLGTILFTGEKAWKNFISEDTVLLTWEPAAKQKLWKQKPELWKFVSTPDKYRILLKKIFIIRKIKNIFNNEKR